MPGNRDVWGPAAKTKQKSLKVCFSKLWATNQDLIYMKTRDIYLSVCLSFCVSVCLSICLSVCLSVGLWVCWSVGLSVCGSVCLSVCGSVGLSVCRSVGLSVCRSVGLSFCRSLSLSLSLSLSVWLAVCLYLCLCLCLCLCHRRKFRSQTSGNMDRWKSRGGKSQRREEQKKEERRKKMRAREKVEKSRFTVFFPRICGSGGSKSRLAKAAGGEPSGQMRGETLHAVVARSALRNRLYKAPQLRTTF